MKKNYFKTLIFTIVMLATLGTYAQQTICVGAIKNYSVNTPGTGPAGSTYAWTVTPAAFAGTITGTPSVNANAITINWGTTPAGVYTLQVIETNASGCPGAPVNLTITIEAAPANPVVTLDQPTCTVATGTITVTPPATGTGYMYSIDGVNYQVSNIFNSVTTGSYNVTIKSAGGCISGSTPAVINAQPAAPSAPVASVTQQPSCAVATGTITVTGPTGTGYEYSVDGTNYQTGMQFTGLTAGATYNVTVKVPGGCISTATTLTIDAQPVAPVTPTVVVTQPTCSQPMATIEVSAPLGTGLTYSIDGVNYQTSPIFNNVGQGTYPVTVQNAGGCFSSIQNETVNPQPAAPTTSAIIFN